MKESALGKSVIVYHGTKVAFDKFDFDKASDGAHFFTPIKEHAEHFGNVKAYRIVIDNPLVISQDDLEAEWDKEHPDGEQDDRHLLPRDFIDEFVLQAKAKEHDGLIIERFADLDFQTTVYLPFSPEQIHNAELVSEQTIDIEGRQSMKERNTLESIVYAQATTQMLSHSSSFKNALDAMDYLGHCVKKHIEPIGLVRKAPFETMDWPRVHDYVKVIATQNIATMKNLLDVAHKGMVEGAMEGEFDSADMNMLDLEYMMDRGNVLDAIKVPQSIAAGVSSPTYTDKALAAARGDLIVPLGDLKAVAYVDDESGVPAIKAQSPAVLEELLNRAMSLDSIVVNQDKTIDVDTWFFDMEDTDASLSGLGRVLKRLDTPAETITRLIIDLKAAHGGHDYAASKTIDDAKSLVHDVLLELNLPEPQWRQSATSITPWEYTDVEVGGYKTLVLGASSGGVVSVDGDPFTPEKREANVTFSRVMNSVEHGIRELLGQEKKALFDLLPEFASKTANRKQFRDVITGRFSVTSDSDKEKIFTLLELQKGTSFQAFSASLDSYWDSQKTQRQERTARHKQAVRNSEHESLVQFALHEYARTHGVSTQQTDEEATNLNMINVAIYDTRNAAFADIGKQVEVVRILKEAAKFIRDNDVYEGVQLHDVNGNKVGAISGGWGNMGNDVHTAFVNPKDSKEVARLIDEVANFVEKGTTVFYLHDIDGNSIGQGATIEWLEEQALNASVDDVHNDMQM